MSFFRLVFRAAFSVWRSKPYFYFGFQSHCLFQGWHSKPSYLLQFGVYSRIFSLVFRVVVCFQFSIQSHHIFLLFGVSSRIFSLAFRAASLVIIFLPFWHSESHVWRSELHLQSSYFLHFGIQSRCLFLVQHSEPSYPSFGIWSHYFFSFGIHSHIIQFGVQSRRLFLVRHLKPSYLFPFGIQSRIFSQAFKVVVYFQFDIQSHHISFSLAFKAIFSVWRSKLYFQFGIQSYCLFLVRHLESLCLSTVWHSEQHFKFGIQSRIFSLDFKFVVCFQVSIQPSYLLQFGVQILIFSLVFRVVVCFQFGIQSRHLFLPFGIQSHVFSLAFRVASLAFRVSSSVIIFPPFQRSESFVSSLAFRAIISLVWHSEPLFFQLQRSQPHYLVWRSEPLFVSSLAFKATMFLQFNIQSHHIPSVRRSEPYFSLAFKVVVCFQFSIRSHHISSLWAFRVASSVKRSESLFIFSSTFRAIISPLVWPSKPYFHFGVQSRIFSLAFRVIVCFQFDIQSHYVFLPFGIQSRIFSLAFKVVFLVWILELLFVSRSTFRAIISLSIWHSELHLQFGVQSRCLFLVRHSKLSCLFSVWRSEPLFVSSSTFKAISVWLSESLFVFRSAFKAIISLSIWSSELHIQFGIQSRSLFLVQHSKPSCLSSI